FRVAAPASAIAWAIQDLYGVTTTLADAPALGPTIESAAKDAAEKAAKPEAETETGSVTDTVSGTVTDAAADTVTLPRRLPPAHVVEDTYGDETPIPMPVPFDETTGRIVLIDPRSLAGALASLDRRPTPSPGHPVAEAALHEAVLALEVANDRDLLSATLVAYMRKLCRRAAFFVVRRGELVGYAGSGLGIRMDTLRESLLRLDRASTFRDIVQTRLPFRGPVTDAQSRDFRIEGLGWAPTDVPVLPLSVRARVVALVYGDERIQPLPDDHLATLTRAAELALERALLARKQP